MMNISHNTLRQQRLAFTLIEMLVVIAIIALLASLIIGGVQRALDSSKRVACLSNTRSIALAVQSMRIDRNDGLLPYRGDSHLNYGIVADTLLPYVGDDVTIFDCPANNNECMPQQEIPSQPEVFTEYEFNGRLGNFSTTTDRRFSGITTPSLAAFVYDRPYWDTPNNPHKTGANVGYMDGHAAWLSIQEMGIYDDSEPFFEKGHDY